MVDNTKKPEAIEDPSEGHGGDQVECQYALPEDIRNALALVQSGVIDRAIEELEAGSIIFKADTQDDG